MNIDTRLLSVQSRVMGVRVHLLGVPRIQVENTWPTPASGKTAALLYYLAYRDGWIARDELLYLLWPDTLEAKARSNLRKLLSRSIRDSPFTGELEIEPGRLRWSVSSDVFDFQQALEAQRFTDAVELYKGELLYGFVLEGAPEFANWLEQERVKLHGQWRNAALASALVFEAEQRQGEAIVLLQRLLNDDPLDEEAVQLYLRCAEGSEERKRALEAFERFSSMLSDEMALEPLAATVELASRVRQGTGRVVIAPQVEVEPAPKSRPSPPLPPELTPFVDRPVELQEISERLDQSDCRLLTLTGTGGVGKTRLALKTLMNRESRYQHGVYAVALAQVETFVGLLSRIAVAIGQPLESDDPEEELLRRLKNRSMLLFLDNFDRLVGVAPWLNTLLAAAPNVTLIATSREALNLHGEWLYHVKGLGYPEAGEVASTDWPVHGAVQLFKQTAERLGAVLSLEDVPAIVRICRLVEGVPLAIELAASWMRVLGAADIAGELERNIDFLSSTGRDLPERHQSMRAVFEASWKLLTPEQQRVLSELTVFRAGFDRVAAERIVGASVRVLLELVSKSLLRRRQTGRFDLHPLIRHYGVERIQKAESFPGLQLRHTEYYLRYLAESESRLEGTRQSETAVLLSMDQDNFLAAWREAGRLGRADLIDAALSTLFDFFILGSRYREGLQVVREVAGVLVKAGTASATLRARLQAREGAFLARIGSFEEAKVLLEACLGDIEEKSERAFVYEYLSQYVLYWLDEVEASRALAEQALALYREMGDIFGMAKMNYYQGSFDWHAGDYRGAMIRLQTGRDMFEKLGDLRWAALCCAGLGLVSYEQEDYRRAEQLLTEALDLFKKLGSRHWMANAEANLGLVWAKEGDHQAALRGYRRALTVLREVEDWPWVAEVHSNIGRSLLAVGDPEGAKESFRASLSTSLDCNSKSGMLRALIGFAHLAVQSRPEDALTLYLFASRHPITVHTDKKIAQEGLEAMKPTTEQLAAAGARAEELELVATAEQLFEHGELS
ncbi:MAG: tetratricopeptide repeat protein [Trueperaceae bacterium]|nr:MAG: tetratricopeptide repeat protein [Trueperaceae bacterium]